MNHPIIEKYYLKPNSKLVKHQKGTKGVDCWFENSAVRQHRCLTFEDFDHLTRENSSKPIGMILIKGVNDEAYAKYIASIKPVTEQVMISVVKNRW